MLKNYLLFLPFYFLAIVVCARDQNPPSSPVTWAYSYSFNDGINEQSPAVTHITPTKDGGYLLSGGNYLFKVDRLGQSQWQKLYYCGACRIESTVQTSDGGYLSANVYDDLTSSYIFVYRLDSTGNVKWERIHALTIAASQDGGVLLGTFQGTLIKADSNAIVASCKTLFVPSSMPLKTITVSVETRVPNVQQSPIKVLFYSTNPTKNLGGGGQSVCSP